MKKMLPHNNYYFKMLGFSKYLVIKNILFDSNAPVYFHKIWYNRHILK